MMIEKRDEVLTEYTTEYLLAYRKLGDGQRQYANRLLQAPPSTGRESRSVPYR